MSKKPRKVRDKYEYENPKGDLVKRFNPQKAQIAQQISNDISEGIDNGHSKRELRMAVAYYADLAAVKAERLSNAESSIEICMIANRFMNAALKDEKAAVRKRATLVTLPFAETK